MTGRRSLVCLHWPDKEAKAAVVTPDVLLQEVPSMSVTSSAAADPVFASSDNLLIHGDNHAALAALRADFLGQVRLAYLDPPYNTGNMWSHYDDNREHASWLSMMRDCLLVLVPLLAKDGVVLVQTDRHESAYLKVLLDEVLGREAYVTTIAVRMSATSGYKIEHTDRTIVKNVEYIHVYARELTLCEKAFEESLSYDDHYAYLLTPDQSRFGRLIDCDEVAVFLAASGLAKTNQSLPALYQTSASFRAFVVREAARICRSHTAPAQAKRALELGRLFGATDEPDVVRQETYGETRYFLRRTRSGVDQLIPLALKLHYVEEPGGVDRLALTNILGDWWDGFHLDMGNIDDEGGVSFKSSKKPERLLRRLLRLFTRPQDVVVDVFGGSGTTAAVAHKMRRRWILVEAGEHCRTLAQPRLARVVRGQDPTGVTAAEGWSGGGGFRFCTLVRP
jgi:adenine-specific DNA-methyltransferase